MRYETPRIHSVGMNDLLAKLGPARAMLYSPEAGTGSTSGASLANASSGSGGNGFGLGKNK